MVVEMKQVPLTGCCYFFKQFWLILGFSQLMANCSKCFSLKKLYCGFPHGWFILLASLIPHNHAEKLVLMNSLKRACFSLLSQRLFWKDVFTPFKSLTYSPFLLQRDPQLPKVLPSCVGISQPCFVGVTFRQLSRSSFLLPTSEPVLGLKKTLKLDILS